MTIFILLIIIYNFVLLTLNLPSAWAQAISNSQYKLDINISNIYKDSQKNTQNTQEELPQTNPNVLIGENYNLIYPLDKTLFVFSISPTLIDYGILSPTNSVKRTNTIQVLSKHLSGYTVSAIQNHKLQNSSKTEIPDTSCDTGTCSVSKADVWKNSLTYGFGYRCDNLYDVTSCLNDFANLDYYKKFPSMSQDQDPYLVIQQASPINTKALITYQVNVPRTQKESPYNNIIIFVATPNF